MKKNLSWKFLIPFGIVLALIRAITTGIIPDFLGLLEAIVFILGFVDFLRWLFNRKKTKAE